MDTITITALVENTCLLEKVLAQHGQSFLVEYFDKKYVFDTAGIYEGFMYNLETMHIQLSSIAAFAYSHKDLDHAGSLPQIIDSLTNQPVYILPDFGVPDYFDIGPKYKFYTPGANGKGNFALSEEQTQKIKAYARTIVVEKGLQVEENLFLTGPVAGKITEQAMVIHIPGKGIVVLVGCSHPTLPTMIQKAQEVSGQQSIYGIIGGFHFKDMSTGKIEANIVALKEFNPTFIVPSHCTGFRAVKHMQDALGEKVVVSTTGQFGTGNSIALLPDLIFNLV